MRCAAWLKDAVETSLVEEQRPIEQKPQVTMAAQRKSIDCRNYPSEPPSSGSKYSNESDQRDATG
jgi:hypothetical protein